MVIEINLAPYMLELNKVLVSNETFREKNILIRQIKNKNDVEVCNASYSEIQELEKQVLSNKIQYYPEKEISIKKIVEIFKNTVFPNAILKDLDTPLDRTSGVFFECIKLSGKRAKDINFIYISKHTTQYKVKEYIEKEKILESNIDLIILTDFYNKDDGQIDKNKINKLFSSFVNNVEVHYLEDFAYEELYREVFENDIFHNGNFNINNFIKPYADDNDKKDIILLLKEWFFDDYSPLLVMKGIGGIGKTTVVKYFLDEVYREKRNKNHVLFINSHDIIDKIMKKESIDNLFDFYDIASQQDNKSFALNIEMFELVIDNGHLTIVLDGLDEVIAKMGSKFDINKFIETIYQDYSNNLNKAKIIITCRDYFWDLSSHTNNKIKSFSLNPFNENMIERYFNLMAKTPKKVQNMIELANQFKTDVGGYIPYILDMIREKHISNEAVNDAKTKILMPNNKTDFLIIKATEREIFKLENMNIDKQLDIFMDIALLYNGEVRKIHLKELTKKFNLENIIDIFNAHPLLKYNSAESILTFRYDFFNEYFKNILLSEQIKIMKFDDFNKKLLNVLIQHISFDGSSMKDLLIRLKNIDLDELKLAIMTYFDNHLIGQCAVNSYEQRKINSSLFILLLQLSNPNGTEERTELLKEIYETDGELNNISLINFHTSKPTNKPTFDFRNLVIKNSYFESYEFFTSCKFNDKTIFKNSEFKSPLHQKNINTDLTKQNFDTATCNMEGVIDILNEKENKKDLNKKSIKHDLKQILRLFWSNSAFREKSKGEVHGKLSKYNNLIEILLRNDILFKVTRNTRHKRNYIAYKLNNKYSDLRKIMEENETCNDFEEVVKIIEGV
jgi:hypothetical protein